MNCPDLESLIALVERPEAASCAKAAAHVWECATCAATVREILQTLKDDAIPTAEDEQLAAAVGRSFVRRERRLREVEKRLSASPINGIPVTIGEMPRYRVAAATATAPGSAISLSFAPNCDARHRDYWRAEIELPAGGEIAALLAVKISDGTGRPLTGGSFRFGEADVPNGRGLVLLALADFRANLRSNVVRYVFADGRNVGGRLCL